MRSSKQGTIVGALVGTINLAQPNFLDKVSNSDYGDTGGYLVIAKGQRIIISASDKSRIMEALPEPGSNQIIDRFFGGYRGSDVIFNPAGKAMLVSAAPIPSADWMVISLQPTAEAFAPIRALQERMLIAAFVLTLLTLVIMWMVLRRQLQPVVNTSRKLALMVKGDQPLEPLPVESMDEVGALIGGFNQLLTTLEDREAQIRSFYEFDIVGLTITSPEKGWLRINHSLCNMLEYSEQELRGMTWVELTHPDDLAADIEQFNRLLANEIEGYSLEKRFVSKTGKVIPTQLVVRCVRKSNGDVDYITAMVQDISDRKAAEKAIANLAYFDPLTQLPNRRLLMDRFHTALLGSTRNHLHGAVLFIDMDKFKTINDTLGHNYGDLMLIQVARRIHSCVRDVDTVSRFGGDEFVVILEDIDDSCKTASQKISLIAEKIRLVLTEPYQLNGAEYVCSPSIGISVYCGNAESADVLLKQADMAMYQAKDSGRNSIRFFDPAMQLAVVTRAALESDLRQAVQQQQLHLYYQAQVDSKQHPIGAEALLRWIHPKRGVVSPAEFIPVAEQCLAIIDIGDWVLNAACKQLAVWSTDDRTRHLTLAVNVSAHQFNQSDFVSKVEKILHAYRLDASRLKLELTESVVLMDVANVISKMHSLKALRVKLSMDDFGTGYSSLSYLKQLPLDQLKIDQSFVRDMTIDSNDAVMVQTIIDLAKNFRVNVIAEGVETEEQLSLLKHQGCLTYQGYLFSKPVPIDQFEALLKP